MLDTNTVLYFLGGDTTLAEFLKDKKLIISFITELELLSYKGLGTKDIKLLNEFISNLYIENIDGEIKNISIQIRKKSKLKLPDCIIVATAIALNVPLISADKDLRQIQELDLILFEK